MLANSIHLVISLNIHVERSWISAHAVSKEWESLRRCRQGLRVSFPLGGAQRRPLLLGFPVKKAFIYDGFTLAYSYCIGALVSGEMGNVILPGDNTGGSELNLVYGIKAAWLVVFVPGLLVSSSAIMGSLVLSREDINQHSRLLAKGYTEFKLVVWATKKISSTRREMQREDEDWMPKPGFNSLAVAVACHGSTESTSGQGEDIAKSRLKWGVIDDPRPFPRGKLVDAHGKIVSARDYWAKRQFALFEYRKTKFPQSIRNFRWEEDSPPQTGEGETGTSDAAFRATGADATVEQAGHCGFSKARVGAVRPLALYSGLGGGIDPMWVETSE